MTHRRGLTLAEVLLGVALLALAAWFLFHAATRARTREEVGNRRIRCRNNLNCLAKGMATYLNEYGDNRFYPFPLGYGLKPDDFSGAEWLASLYWTRVIPDPAIFLCPSSGDTNNNGRDLGTRAVAGRFGSQTVSYAAMHYRSLTDTDGKPKAAAIRDDFPPNELMASDDTEGSINHGQANSGGMAVLFFDSHVEFWTHTRIDLVHGVGLKGGPLWRLRN